MCTAVLAQWLERNPSKIDVVGSNPTYGSTFKIYYYAWKIITGAQTK